MPYTFETQTDCDGDQVVKIYDPAKIVVAVTVAADQDDYNAVKLLCGRANRGLEEEMLPASLPPAGSARFEVGGKYVTRSGKKVTIVHFLDEEIPDKGKMLVRCQDEILVYTTSGEYLPNRNHDIDKDLVYSIFFLPQSRVVIRNNKTGEPKGDCRLIPVRCR